MTSLDSANETQAAEGGGVSALQQPLVSSESFPVEGTALKIHSFLPLLLIVSIGA